MTDQADLFTVPTTPRAPAAAAGPGGWSGRSCGRRRCAMADLPRPALQAVDDGRIPPNPDGGVTRGRTRPIEDPVARGVFEITHPELAALVAAEAEEHAKR